MSHWSDFPNPTIFKSSKSEIDSLTSYLFEAGEEDQLFVYTEEEVYGAEEIVLDDDFLQHYNPDWSDLRKKIEKAIILGQDLPTVDDPLFQYKISFISSPTTPVNLTTAKASSITISNTSPKPMKTSNSKKASFADNNIVSAHIKQMNFSQSFEVGGFLRDQILNIGSKDVDIAVCGETYESLVEKISASGLVYRIDPLDVHGQLIGVRVQADWAGEGGVEIALSRTEHSTGKKHQDFAVVTSPDIDIRQDLARRDFTVNAIARNLTTGEIIDPFGGIRDAEQKKLKMISENSFVDDPLRLLRGVVRVGKNDFTVEQTTFSAMKRNAYRLVEGVSQERIKEEFEKLLMADYTHHGLIVARDTTVLQHAIPEFAVCVGFDQENRHHDLTVDEHIFMVVDNACKAEANQVVRFAALFHDIGKPQSAWRGEDGQLHFAHNKRMENCPESHEIIGAKITRDIWTRWGGDTKTKNRLNNLVKNHMYQTDNNATEKLAKKEPQLRMRARRWITRIGPENAEDLLLLRRCDNAGKKELAVGWDKDLNVWQQIVREELNNTPTLKTLELDGNDLLKMGFKGKQIGDTLDVLLRRVIDQPEYNEFARLKSWALKLK